MHFKMNMTIENGSIANVTIFLSFVENKPFHTMKITVKIIIIISLRDVRFWTKASLKIINISEETIFY